MLLGSDSMHEANGKEIHFVYFNIRSCGYMKLKEDMLYSTNVGRKLDCTNSGKSNKNIHRTHPCIQ